MPVLSKTAVAELSRKATDLRREILKMIHNAASGHPGGALSVLDILLILYYQVMRVDPRNPNDRERDRLVFSKGHACAALYAVLADRGFFPFTYLQQFRKIDSILQGHPDMRKTPGVDFSTGSLGQGLSAAGGMALAARLDGSPRRIYAVLGDGEIQEGQVWEAAMTAAHYRLDNLTAILDYNGLQIDGWVREIKSVEPLTPKWKAFGWNLLECDGHDYSQLLEALQRARANRGAPTMIIARTVKGKGVPFMENRSEWHGSPPGEEELARALEALQ